MGRRRYQRLRVAERVKVSGLDAQGNPFVQTVTTVDISPHGLCVRGLGCLRGPGSIVQVEFKGKRARYRVAWVGAANTPQQDYIGLQDLEGGKFLFPEHLPAEVCQELMLANDPYVVKAEAPPATAPVPEQKPDRREAERRLVERRRWPRYPCAGTARVWQDDSEMPVNARVNELSLGGCYIEIMSPFRVGTNIRLELSVNNKLVRLAGVVRTMQAAFGMGVEFTAIVDPEQRRLQQIISELSGVPLPAEAPAPAVTTSVPRTAPHAPSELGEEVLRWFATHDALSRQEFLRLVNALTVARPTPDTSKPENAEVSA